ncbi:MAG: hypothetical protein E7588_00730 [Ruminococcaceae bacterium]|nr:hypothetical protein [Oscillospiraceae bacterium]
MFKNISQYIRHNLKIGRSIIILLTVVMLICGPIPVFMEIGDYMDRFDNRIGIEKMDYARTVERQLRSIFDLTDEYYSIFLSLIAAVAGLVLAYVLFFHFRKKNSADFFLSLPLTRTECYIANFISGVIYYVIPLLFTSVVTIVGLNIMGSWKFLNISKLLFMSAENNGMLAMLGNNLAFFLLFFAIGTVAVLLTSNGINALVVYGTINFYPIVFLAMLLASAEIFNNDIIDFSEKILKDILPITPIVRILVYNELAPTVWTYVMAVISSVIIGALGCFICNIRPAESWSSAIVFKPLRLILQYMYCFIVAFAGGLFFYAVSDRSVINIIVGSVIGLVVSFMVLNIIFERDVKAIFKKPLRLLWSALIFIVVFVVIVIDIFGIFRYREPALSQVDYVEVSLNHSVITQNYYTVDEREFCLSRMESDEEKEAAIKLYTMLHEQIRNGNYSYLFNGPENSVSYSGLKIFDDIALSNLGRSNHVVVRMMKNQEEIRPLRSSYFTRTEEMYELYKTIYDSPSYSDPVITVLEDAEFVWAQPGSNLLRYSDNPAKLAIYSKDVLEELRLALIEDYKNTDFEGLQDNTQYTLELLYNLNGNITSLENEKTFVTAIQTVDVADYDVMRNNVDYERNMTISIPAGFTRTLEILRKYSYLDEIDNLVAKENAKIVKIDVQIYSDEEPLRITEVTDREEIDRILNDTVNRVSHSMSFPKRGVVLYLYTGDVEYSPDSDMVYMADYAKYQDADNNVRVDFLKRNSTLY